MIYCLKCNRDKKLHPAKYKFITNRGTEITYCEEHKGRFTLWTGSDLNWKGKIEEIK